MILTSVAISAFIPALIVSNPHQLERQLGMWKTGVYQLSEVKAENNFSSDNWAYRSKQLLPSVLALKATSWEIIYEHALLTFKSHDELYGVVEDDNVEPEEQLPMLCSDPDFRFAELELDCVEERDWDRNSDEDES